MYVGGFPHKCQLVAKGISISHRRNRWSAFGDARVRFMIRLFSISVNSELMRILINLMIFFKVIFMAFQFY